MTPQTDKPKTKTGSTVAGLAKPKALLAGALLLVVLAVLLFVLLGGDDQGNNSGQPDNQPLPVTADNQPLVVDPALPPVAGFEARNDQRHLDVGKVIGVVKQAIGSDDQAPARWSDVSQRLDPVGLQLYDQVQINSRAPDWVGSARPGDFIDFSSASSQNPVPRLVELVAAIGTGQMLVFVIAACNYDNNAVEVGGASDLVVAYRLEGQAGITCVDI